jgi:23S rRNA (uracil1939-C5)-methyltransferase
MKNRKPLIIPEAPATIRSLNNEGVGIATVDGKTTFIEGALPDENVKYRIFKKHRHYDEAACVEILTSSTQRASPLCTQFGTCGGCSMQHLNSTAQIEWKEKILTEQLEHIGHVKPDALIPALAASVWNYRHKARLGVRYVEKQQKALVGFRQKFRHQIADIDLCPVLHPTVGTRLPLLSDLITSLDIKEHIPQIEVAIGEEQTALVFRHLKPLSEQDTAKLTAFGKEHHIHIYLQPNPPLPISLLWPEGHPHRLKYFLPDFNIEMLFHPMDFTQIHLEINRLMLKQAITLLDPQPSENVLDLFCGIGNFSLPLARFANQVTAVEGSELMVERGYENAKHNNIENVNFYAANLFEPLPNEAWARQTYEKILLDPPRTGAKEIVAQISQLKPNRIVYVSCNPATLARDADLLVNTFGFKLKQAGVMNMFPHTSHIEAMAVFESK